MTFYIKLALMFFCSVVWSGPEKGNQDVDLKLREEMVRMSRQLGVTCTHCHNPNNFKSAEKPPFKIAKDHMRIVDLLNREGFKGNPKVDCYICHLGHTKPDYHEKWKSH